MTEFNSPPYRVDALPVDALVWNADVVDNLIALNERLATHYPYAIVQNTAVDTTLFVKEIPAGSLGPNGFFTISLAGILQNNSGSTRSPIIRVRLGATIVTGTNASIATGVNRIIFVSKFGIQNKNDEASQLIVVEQKFGTSPVPAGVSMGITHQGKWDTSSIDTTASNDLTVSCQLDLSTSHPTYSFEMLYATVIGPIYKA